MILPFAMFLLGLLGLGLTAKDLKDFRRREAGFSEWIVSDANPLNRRLWRAYAWVRMIALPIVSVVCLVGAFDLILGK